MSLDMQKLGRFVQETMEDVERDHPDSELGEVMLVLEVKVAPTDGSEYGKTIVRYDCTDTRRWAQYGLAQAAIWAIEQGKRPGPV